MPTLLLRRAALALLAASALFAGSRSAPAGAASPGPERGETRQATFAGGCFWCMVPPFARLPGVLTVTSGYTGGLTKSPSYEQVSSGVTGHAESVQVVYDPGRISYAQLLDVYWHNVDPTDGAGQFCDRGEQYRTAIFVHGEEQRRLAVESKGAVTAQLEVPGPIVTQIVPASAFYPAEEYHQDYYRKNPVRYRFYRFNCGRDRRLEEVWGKAPEH